MHSALSETSANRCFGGWHKRFTHTSTTNQCEMQFAIFLPANATKDSPVPVLYWLSGLTCTDENFMQKAGAMKLASELGLAIVAPDTSPRGESVPDDPEGNWDFGLGAGFYVNATEAPWNTHYNMYDYVSKELPELVESSFPVTDKKAISGHSMGGHGALITALKEANAYCSVSAFAPITHPVDCPWGQKAFSNYLGKDKSAWLNYDTCELIRAGTKPLPTLIDQGTNDSFLDDQLKPQSLKNIAEQHNYPLTLRMQEAYDHSYFFIASFVDEHLLFHAEHLGIRSKSI